MGNCCCLFIRLVPFAHHIHQERAHASVYKVYIARVRRHRNSFRWPSTKDKDTENKKCHILFRRMDVWTDFSFFLLSMSFLSVLCEHWHHRLLWHFCYKIKLIWFARMHLRSETYIILQCCSHNALLSKGKQCCRSKLLYGVWWLMMIKLNSVQFSSVPFRSLRKWSYVAFIRTRHHHRPRRRPTFTKTTQTLVSDYFVPFFCSLSLSFSLSVVCIVCVVASANVGTMESARQPLCGRENWAAAIFTFIKVFFSIN